MGPMTREQFEKLADWHEHMARELGHSDTNVKNCRDLGIRMWLYLTPELGHA